MGRRNAFRLPKAYVCCVRKGSRGSVDRQMVDTSHRIVDVIGPARPGVLLQEHGVEPLHDLAQVLVARGAAAGGGRGERPVGVLPLAVGEEVLAEDGPDNGLGGVLRLGAADLVDLCNQVVLVWVALYMRCLQSPGAKVAPKRHSAPKSDCIHNTCLLFDSCERKLPLSVL